MQSKCNTVAYIWSSSSLFKTIYYTIDVSMFTKSKINKWIQAYMCCTK